MPLPQRAKGGVAAAVLDGVRGTTAGRLLLMVPVVEGGTGELDPKRRIDVAAGGELRRRSEEHTSELQSRPHLVCRLLLEKKNPGIGHPTLLRLRGAGS